MYGLGIAKGLWVTFKHLFRSPVTIQYPEEVRPIPVTARTNLIWFEERCTGCSTCAQACPDGCILVATSPAEGGALNVDRYEIDFRICMYCGLCTEACPYQAIQAGGTWRDVSDHFNDLYRDRKALTKFAKDYLKENDYMYPHGQRAPQDYIELIEREA
jgi:NADH-quinone oxidoreductase subunit I